MCAAGQGLGEATGRAGKDGVKVLSVLLETLVTLLSFQNQITYICFLEASVAGTAAGRYRRCKLSP